VHGASELHDLPAWDPSVPAARGAKARRPRGARRSAAIGRATSRWSAPAWRASPPRCSAHAGAWTSACSRPCASRPARPAPRRRTSPRSSTAEVTSRKQAIAIGLSEARRAGGKVPARSRKKK